MPNANLQEDGKFKNFDDVDDVEKCEVVNADVHKVQTNSMVIVIFYPKIDIFGRWFYVFIVQNVHISKEDIWY